MHKGMLTLRIKVHLRQYFEYWIQIILLALCDILTMVLPYFTLQIAALPLEANNNTTTGTSNEPADPPKKSSTLPPMSSAKYTGTYAQQVRPRNPV